MLAAGSIGAASVSLPRDTVSPSAIVIVSRFGAWPLDADCLRASSSAG